MAGVTSENDILSLLSRGDLVGVVEQLTSYFTHCSSAVVQIAVVGKSGSGKSTFINASRGLHEDDSGAAPIGQRDTTMEPKAYKYPNKDLVVITEFPWLRSQKPQGSAYSESIQINLYDSFVILSSSRFREKHVRLAREVEKEGKKFYFVRTKIDCDLAWAKRWQKCCYHEDQTLEKLRSACLKSLRKQGIESPRVFLISSWKPNRFDFGKLLEGLEGDLPEVKRRSFLLSLPNFTSPIIERKKEAILNEVWKVASLSAAASAVPIPGLSIASDVTLLVSIVSSYRTDFGLDDQSLGRLAKRVGKTPGQLRSAVSSTLGQDVSKATIMAELVKASGPSVVLAKVVKFVPWAGQVAAAGISYTTTNTMLKTTVEEMAEDAKRVLEMALLVD
ncbi:interferon-inducible GTPase 5-like [Cetorhinus maximus]